jgi:hypothetical protein
MLMRAAHAVSHLGTRGKPRCSVLYCTVTRAGPRQAQQRAVGRRERGKEDKRKSPPPLTSSLLAGHTSYLHILRAQREVYVCGTHTRTRAKKKKSVNTATSRVFLFSFPSSWPSLRSASCQAYCSGLNSTNGDGAAHLKQNLRVLRLIPLHLGQVQRVNTFPGSGGGSGLGCWHL